MAGKEKDNKTKELIGSSSPAPAEAPKGEAPELTELKQSKTELEKKILYLYAEIENVRKRLQKEKLEYAKNTRETMLNDFFPVFLSLNRALNHCNETPESLKQLFQGVKMTMKEIDTLFNKHGLKQITGINCSFDPHRHEALESEEKEGLKDRMVLEEYEPGFTVYDQLVRPAKVKVGIPTQKKIASTDEKSEGKTN